MSQGPGTSMSRRNPLIWDHENGLFPTFCCLCVSFFQKISYKQDKMLNIIFNC